MGSIPEPQKFLAACGYCKTEFEFTTDEIEKRDFYKDEGPKSTWFEIKCPLCKRTVIHPQFPQYKK